MNLLPGDFFYSPPSLTFVLGTDTGVGKTRLMGLLARMAPVPESVRMVKAVQTGVSGPDDFDRDARTYRIEGSVSRAQIWEGYSFALPVDPMTAAKNFGTTLDPLYLAEKIRSLYLEGTHVLVEGSGGVLSPFFPDGSGILAVMKAVGIPFRVVLVAHPHLGTLSHVLSAVRVLEGEGMVLSALYLCPRAGISDEATKHNPGTLRALLPGIPVFLLDSF